MTRQNDPKRAAEREALGLRLQVLRTAAGKTQAEVAKALKVGRMTVSHWEQGTYELAALDVPRLAELYKVDVTVIHGLTPLPLIKASEP